MMRSISVQLLQDFFDAAGVLKIVVVNEMQVRHVANGNSSAEFGPHEALRFDQCFQDVFFRYFTERADEYFGMAQIAMSMIITFNLSFIVFLVLSITLIKLIF